MPEPAAEAKQSASSALPAERRRAVRVLKSLPRVIERIDLPEGEKSCPCCGERMRAFAHESSGQLPTPDEFTHLSTAPAGRCAL